MGVSDSSSPSGPQPIENTWTDERGRGWTIRLTPDSVTLRSGDDSLAIARENWARDIYIAEHGTSYIIRFETFDLEIGFVVPGGLAAPLIQHLGARREVEQAATALDPEPASSAPLLWPKVSRLAVWALISAALVFIPGLGLLAAAAVVTLVLLHRRRIRPVRAWSHSRTLCRLALILLGLGLVVNVVASIGLVSNIRHSRAADGPGPDEYTENDPVPAQPGESPASEGRNWGLLVAGLAVVLVSLTFHEAGHATVAWWLGDDLARRLGRVTLNPLAHVDPLGTIVLPLILFLANAGVFGWARPVPVRTESFDNPRRGHILVSLAGPGANLLLACLSLMLMLGLVCALGHIVPDARINDYASLNFFAAVTASGFELAPIVGAILTILKLSFVINIFLAFFNLIPIPPLDGSWVLEHLFPRTVGAFYRGIRPYGFILFLGLIYTGVLYYLLIPALLVLIPGLMLLSSCTIF